MVATAGPGWVLAPCLVGLIRETDKLYPLRATSADGSIGDQAHATRDSDHNPDGGYVRAVDITDDDYHGCDVAVLAHHLVAARDERVKYLIHKGTIWKSYASNGIPAWKPQVYTGANAHDHHLHVSIRTGQERTTGPWWPAALPAPPIAPQEADMFFASAKANSNVWFFEQGRRTLVNSATDRAALAKAAGIPNVVAEISDDLFGRLADGRTRHQ